MSTDENKALVRRFYAEIDKGNLAAMDELVAEEYLDHSPPPFPGLRHGREGLKQAFQIFWEGTPGYHRIDDQIADGEIVEKSSEKDVLGFLPQIGVMPAPHDGTG